MSFEELRERHGDQAVDAAVRFINDAKTKSLFPDLDRLYKALKGDRAGLRPTQVVQVGKILNEFVQPNYGNDAQSAVYLLKAVAKNEPPKHPKDDPRPLTPEEAKYAL